MSDHHEASTLDLATLRRWPDVEDPTLFAHDATDTLIIERALDEAATRGIAGTEILVLGERHGAITLSLAAAGFTGMKVVQDRLAHERALAANARELGLEESWTQVNDVATAAADARMILWQLPRAVTAVEHRIAALRDVSPGALLIAGGRIKHLSVGMNAPIGEGFGPVVPQLAHKKSRLLLATRQAGLTLNLPEQRPATHSVAGQRITLMGEAESFGGSALDPGTKFLLETLRERNETPAGSRPSVVDLGCGNGTIAVWAALRWPNATLHATDDSADAVAAAIASATHSGVSDRVEVTRADAGDHLPEASADVVILNPPFHQGGTVHTGIASKLMRSAARLLKPGGILICVWNSHLRYRPRLERIVGPTEQWARNKTFTVTASTRRG